MKETKNAPSVILPAPSCLRLLLAAGLARPMQGLAYITRPTPKEPMGDTMDTPVLIARFR